MNQAELTAAVALATGETKAAAWAKLTALGNVVRDELKKGGEVTLPGIGKLAIKNRPGRTGRNPRTGEAINIPAKNVPHFGAAKALKDAVA